MQNFGNINNAFNEMLIDSIVKKDDKRKKIYQNFLKTLKENDVLKAQYLVYKNLENKVESDSSKAIDYVNENISFIHNKFSTTEIKKANEKLISLLGEHKKCLDMDYEKKKLHENISFLIQNEKTPKNIDRIVESRHDISSYILNNQEKEIVSESYNVPSKVLAEISLNKFNEKYADLDENTKETLRTILEVNNEKKELFLKEKVKKCIDLLNENLTDTDITTKEKLLQVKERLLQMEYNEKKFTEDIVKVINLINDLED